jgi:spoIIIJ-associated protein
MMEPQNPEEVFCEGRNEEEALQAACDRLNTTPNQVEYEVVESGAAGGVLGFLKGRTVRIRVWRKSESQRKLAELVKGFCNAFDVGLTCEINKVDDGFEVAFETEGSDGLLIGRGGETLAALQHLLSRMAAHMDETLRVHVDVAGYRRRRQEKLRRDARDLADRCLGAGREMVTEPLPADERRVVHLALAEDPRVETRAIGEGLTKRVAVVPSSGKAGAAAGRSEASASGAGSGERGGRERRGDGHRVERRGDSARHGEGRRGPERDASRGDGPSGSRRPGSPGRSEMRTPADRLRSATRAIEERQRAERPEPSDRPERPECAYDSERSERGESRESPRHDDRAERAERPAHPSRGERPRRHAPPREPVEAETAAAERRAPSVPEAEPATAEREAPAVAARSGEEGREGSYFRIPDRVGLVTPAPEKSEPEGETEPSEPKPLTFGRRPRAGRRRR